jgi:cell division protein FtsB
MIRLADELEQQVKGWRTRYFGLSREFGEIINQQQDKIISLQQENKRLKREIWNLKKTKGRRK